jgi:hypothetical protein
MFRLLTFCAVLFIASCAIPTTEAPLGEWKGAQWLVKGQVSGRNAEAVEFTFNEEGQYTAAYGNQEEEGTYRLEGNQLFTKSEGVEKMVQYYLSEGKDTLILDMNRGGTMEQLVLIKK